MRKNLSQVRLLWFVFLHLLNLDPPVDKITPCVNLFKYGELEKALNAVEVLLKEFPGSSNLYNLHGIINARLSLPKAAVAYREKPDLGPS